MLRLHAHGAIPIEAEPGEVVEDCRGEFRTRAGAVDVFDAQQKPSAGGSGFAPGGESRMGVAEMQPAGRARRKPGDACGAHRGPADANPMRRRDMPATDRLGLGNTLGTTTLHNPFPLDGPLLAPATGGKAKHLVILLHRLGSDGNDLIGLAPHWAPTLPDVAFASPNAPFPCDMAPYGYQWFSFLDRSAPRILAGVQAAAPVLQSFIDQELERLGLEEKDLALVGFSQGTMMALYVALRRAKP